MTTLPQLAVSAALIRGDDVLLIERSRGQTLEGLLSFPGGRVGFGETMRAALSREIFEEVGLTVDSGALTFVTNHEAIHRDFHFVICVFVARIGRDAVPVAGTDAASVRFESIGSVRAFERDGLTTPGLATILDLARKLL
ncbi:NUDIX domain-containing protein [Fulvimarina sp. 2208YS6-2-32]|uniref:NUDIX domain-containing protein n=1 Tax=Fulvimarina uroteuthidis TaxID=3098149 RepID=A0ABU5I503_9HYPH|nr:NUDIX domain-containing protein [Fulvimarina sp. 2208YS6-2-32]MDY8110476.1 NUDIX domain-containing protein [Fulvimarina sp. 2208YS6-2-32]